MQLPDDGSNRGAGPPGRYGQPLLHSHCASEWWFDFGVRCREASANGNLWGIALGVRGPSEVSDWSADASAGVEGQFAASGPLRSGFLKFGIIFGVADLASSPELSAGFEDGTHRYAFSRSSYPVPPSTCGTDCIRFTGELPFQFGSGQTFLANLSDHIHEPALPNLEILEQDSIEFSLFEADGTTPVSFRSLNIAPEPASCLLLLFGLGGLAVRRRSLKHK